MFGRLIYRLESVIEEIDDTTEEDMTIDEIMRLEACIATLTDIVDYERTAG